MVSLRNRTSAEKCLVIFEVHVIWEKYLPVQWSFSQNPVKGNSLRSGLNWRKLLVDIWKRYKQKFLAWWLGLFNIFFLFVFHSLGNDTGLHLDNEEKKVKSLYMKKLAWTAFIILRSFKRKRTHNRLNILWHKLFESHYFLMLFTFNNLQASLT